MSAPRLLLTVAAAVCSATAKDGQRPDYATWEDAQANATVEAAAKVAKEAKMAAFNKVVALLSDVKSQVLSEGEAEAASYNRFACFCKDTSKAKSESIKQGQDEKDSLSADIKELESRRDELDTNIKTKQDEIATAESDMEKASATREAELKAYTINEADLKNALDALAGAIMSLKTSKQPSMLQLQVIAKTVRTAALLADALGLASGLTAQRTLAFLQQSPEVPMDNYKFHSDDIIANLEKLQGDFRKEKEEVDKEEVSAVAAHNMFMQQQKNFVKNSEEDMEDAKKKKSHAQEEIAMTSQQLTTVSATLLEDQNYLNELSQMCHDKAKTWDQRSALRQLELSTLSEVIEILKDEVSGNTTAATVRLAQQGVSVRLAQQVALDEPSMMAVEAEAEAAEAVDDGAPVSFLQRRRQEKSQARSHGAGERRHSLRAPHSAADAKRFVADLLLHKGQDLGSTLLTALATKIADDPFAKVKQLIQELIERLLQESANEANQKGWCDKAISDAEQKRDYAAKEVEELNGELARFEGLRDRLAQELSVLADEISSIKAEQAKAEQLRSVERLENGVTVKEAMAGMEALDQAITIFTRFYKTAAKATVSFSLIVKQSPMEVAPDAGFAVGEAYKGMQGESGGIVGMMEVMKSDFQRTIKETQAAEAKAEQDHLAFMTETGKSLAEKAVAEDQKTSQKADVDGKLATADEGLQSQTGILETSVKELMELKPVCLDTGMSYQERVSRREDEISALNKALCILDAYQQYGPGGLSDAC